MRPPRCVAFVAQRQQRGADHQHRALLCRTPDERKRVRVWVLLYRRFHVRYGLGFVDDPFLVSAGGRDRVFERPGALGWYIGGYLGGGQLERLVAAADRGWMPAWVSPILLRQCGWSRQRCRWVRQAWHCVLVCGLVGRGAARSSSRLGGRMGHSVRGCSRLRVGAVRCPRGSLCRVRLLSHGSFVVIALLTHSGSGSSTSSGEPSSPRSSRFRLVVSRVAACLSRASLDQFRHGVGALLDKLRGVPHAKLPRFVIPAENAAVATGRDVPLQDRGVLDPLERHAVVTPAKVVIRFVGGGHAASRRRRCVVWRSLHVLQSSTGPQSRAHPQPGQQPPCSWMSVRAARSIARLSSPRV